MTIPTNYTNLLLAVQEELEDSGSEFIANIPTAVRLAEDRINRDVDGLFNKYEDTANTVNGVRTVTKPAGHKLSYSVHLKSNNVFTPLVKKNEDYLLDYWPEITSVGTPKYYTDVSKTQIALAPTPNGTIQVVFSYAKNNDYLSTSNLTNPIIDFYGDLLFKATLVEQSKFARMPEATGIYENDYQTRLALVNEETRRERTDNTSPRDRVQIDENRKNKGQ
jgi:hypothetical protein